MELAEREAKRALEKLKIESEEMVKLKTLELEQQSLGAEEDYTKLKREVLKHFGLTESGYINRFNSSKANSEDKPGGYIRRTRHYLKRWVELSGIEKTYDGQFDLILKNKILRSVNKDIRQHILIHNPRTVDEVEKQCDNYFAIFPTKQLGDSPDAPTELIAAIAEPMPSVSKVDRRLSRSNSPHFRHSYRHNTRSSKSPIYRHHPRDNSGPRRSQFTRYRQNSDSDSDSYVQSPGPSRQTTRTYNNLHRSQTKCFSCDLKGHIAADCDVDTEWTQRQGRKKSPKVDKNRNKQKVSFRNNKRCLSPEFSGECEDCEQCINQMKFTLPIRNIVSDQWEKRCKGKLPIVSEKLVNQTVTVLRDTGSVVIACRKQLVDRSRWNRDLIVGNVGGAKPPTNEDLGIIAAVETRGQARNKNKLDGKQTYNTLGKTVSAEEFRKQQSNDDTLKNWWKSAKKGDDTPMAGHIGLARTKARIFSEFRWPGAAGDIRKYCYNCDTCQKGKKNIGNKAPLGRSQVVGQPFAKLAIDIVGPLMLTKKRNGFILKAIDLCTRWPEAVPLRSITASEVQIALVLIFNRMGFPELILSDNGSHFTSEIFNKVSKLLGIKLVHSSAYHAMSNGAVERWNGTFKEMLRKITADRQEDWDEFIPAALFAYREVPNEITGYSPFEFMFGTKVKGPMNILRSIFTGEGTRDCKTGNLKAVLTNLLAGDKPDKVVWTEECNRAFGLIHEHLNSEPVLVLADITQPFILRTDASARGIGAVLLQAKEGVLRPVKYVSRKLLPRETRYSTFERGCLAIIWAVGKLALYLNNVHFTLQTDQRALKYLNNCSYSNSRLTRWSLLLQEFKFTIEHIPGKENIADMLSRELRE
ncbi:uncharacterized protein LOC131928170 [Physella acuta]|uniref:uncharacterized protein LOC131928170 n=1 Tax=Physella acuta TaxID=109671 RepID=UPI0027DB7F3D|nr:uncharacterized protein LOC131928170 [Physella acuta]